MEIDLGADRDIDKRPLVVTAGFVQKREADVGLHGVLRGLQHRDAVEARHLRRRVHLRGTRRVLHRPAREGSSVASRVGFRSLCRPAWAVQADEIAAQITPSSRIASYSSRLSARRSRKIDSLSWPSLRPEKRMLPGDSLSRKMRFCIARGPRSSSSTVVIDSRALN